MRTILAFPPVSRELKLKEMRSRPPMGIYTLAGALRSEGFNIKTADPLQLEEAVYENGQESEKILKHFIEEADVLGVSCNSYNWGAAIILIDKARKINANLIVILGGLYPTRFPVYSMRRVSADYVVRGEGEKTLVQLLKAIETGLNPVGKIPGVVSNKEPIEKALEPVLLTKKEIGAVMPAYDLIPDIYNSISIESSRGCTNSCLFCGVPYRKTWRELEPQIVEKRLTNGLINFDKRMPGREVFFAEDCFTTDSNRALKILNIIKEWDCSALVQGRVDNFLNLSFLENVPWDNIASLQLGIECGYNEGLKKIAKGITLNQVEVVLDTIARLGVAHLTIGSFVIGFPWETEKEYMSTLHYAASLSYKYGINISTSILGLYPSSTLWETRDRYGIAVDETIFDDPNWMLDMDLFFRMHQNLNKQELDKIQKLIETYGLLGSSLINIA